MLYFDFVFVTRGMLHFDLVTRGVVLTDFLFQLVHQPINKREANLFERVLRKVHHKLLA